MATVPDPDRIEFLKARDNVVAGLRGAYYKEFCIAQLATGLLAMGFRQTKTALLVGSSAVEVLAQINDLEKVIESIEQANSIEEAKEAMELLWRLGEKWSKQE